MRVASAFELVLAFEAVVLVFLFDGIPDCANLTRAEVGTHAVFIHSIDAHLFVDGLDGFCNGLQSLVLASLILSLDRNGEAHLIHAPRNDFLGWIEDFRGPVKLPVLFALLSGAQGRIRHNLVLGGVVILLQVRPRGHGDRFVLQVCDDVHNRTSVADDFVDVHFVLYSAVRPYTVLSTTSLSEHGKGCRPSTLHSENLRPARQWLSLLWT